MLLFICGMAMKLYFFPILPAIQMKKNGFGSYFSSFIGPEQVRKFLSSIVIKKKIQASRIPVK